jgi:hypothetical protein
VTTTSIADTAELCSRDGCRRIVGHATNHDPYPSEVWDFFYEKDKRKLSKAGFATPRGGAKGAYQNHVARNGKVIIPFERLQDVDRSLYKDGYVIRLLPEQYFEGPHLPKPEFRGAEATIHVGDNAFVLYRTHESFERLPPDVMWTVRRLLKNGREVGRRGNGVADTGQYVLRIPRLGAKPKMAEGAPQGVFAPEYADEETNFLCKCILAWLIIQTSGSPYTLNQAAHLRAILRASHLDDVDAYEDSGVLRHGVTSCPLCMRLIPYSELHSTISFQDAGGLTNASHQVEGSTRSTIVNLFHLMPLLYHKLTHIPTNVGWGHAICNTRLGQRPCYSLRQLIALNMKVGVVRDDGLVDTFGWMSGDNLMIRSPNGAVWIQLNGDIEAGPPSEEHLFDVAVEDVEFDAEPDASEEVF